METNKPTPEMAKYALACLVERQTKKRERLGKFYIALALGVAERRISASEGDSSLQKDRLRRMESRFQESLVGRAVLDISRQIEGPLQQVDREKRAELIDNLLSEKPDKFA